MCLFRCHGPSPRLASGGVVSAPGERGHVARDHRHGLRPDRDGFHARGAEPARLRSLPPSARGHREPRDPGALARHRLRRGAGLGSAAGRLPVLPRLAIGLLLAAADRGVSGREGPADLAQRGELVGQLFQDDPQGRARGHRDRGERARQPAGVAAGLRRQACRPGALHRRLRRERRGGEGARGAGAAAGPQARRRVGAALPLPRRRGAGQPYPRANATKEFETLIDEFLAKRAAEQAERAS